MSALTETPSVPAAPTANVLPQTSTLTTPTGTTFIESPKLSDVVEESENLAAWIVAFKAALAGASTYAALQTAVAALPNP
jgi:hypothetical protein